MPNLYFKIDIDTEVFIEGGKKMKQPIESISNIVIKYTGFTDAPNNYDIYIDKEEFIGDSECKISGKPPYNVRIRGIAKIKAKADLHQNILEDKKPKIVLYQVNVSPFEILETKKSKKPKKMECKVSPKKPN